ncbi:MAG: hypothetical protein PWQ96_1578 [Clostridia bacterium]|jgi:uncharacterized protein YacL|nr:pin domain protein [Clostridiales bacterium]MDK2985935.1 hypothetical protein [Clostridia bacterium]
MLKKILRVLIALLIAAGGLSLSLFLTNFWGGVPEQVKWAITGLATIVVGLFGYSIAPLLMTWVVQITEWLEVRLQKTPTGDIMAGAIGIIIGLIIANLLGTSFSKLPFIGAYLPMVASLILGYLGWSVGVKKKDEVLSALNVFKFVKDKDKNKSAAQEGNYKILDTSVIIDGRIADICKSGFIDGALLIPNFVLEELRHIADSSDLLKRNRGRRGLDILNKIRNELNVKVQIWEEDFEDIMEVDSKLVRLAQVVGGQVVTNDYNLNKVAELQGVKVLNINELANAVKPVVLPGEEMQVQLIKDGKESGQGVGYLDDGTMIVVENSKKYIGETIPVMVTSVLQTAAGRMIFAKPKYSDKKQSSQGTAWREVNAGVSRS